MHRRVRKACVGMAILVVLGLVAGVVLVACGSGASGPAQEQPEGAQLLEARCSRCHGTDKVTQLHQTRAQWEETVAEMMARGAKLSDAEKAALVEYLAETYGP